MNALTRIQRVRIFVFNVSVSLSSFSLPRPISPLATMTGEGPLHKERGKFSVHA